MKALTQRQQRILDVVRQALRDRGVPPTLREMGTLLGYRSTNAIRDHLKALERKGYIALDTCRARGIKLMNEPGAPAFAGTNAGDVRVPVLGRITSGAPQPSSIIDTIIVERRMLHNRSDVFGLRVSGDAMNQAGILNGDYVLVSPEPTIAVGKMVLVTFGEDAFVRYYFPERSFIRFQPANKTMSATYVRREDFKPSMLLGQVIGVFRRIIALSAEPAEKIDPELQAPPAELAAQ